MKRVIYIIAIVLGAILTLWTLGMCFFAEEKLLYLSLLVVEIIDIIIDIRMLRNISDE